MDLSTIWKRARPSNTIRLGNEDIKVKPLTLENSLKLILLLSPYIAKIESKWPRLVAALETTNCTRPKLLELLLAELQQDLAFAPGVVVDAFALCLNTEMEFVARYASAEDLVKALPVLDSVNDFRSLWYICKQLGIVVTYG